MTALPTDASDAYHLNEPIVHNAIYNFPPSIVIYAKSDVVEYDSELRYIVGPWIDLDQVNDSDNVSAFICIQAIAGGSGLRMKHGLEHSASSLLLAFLLKDFAERYTPFSTLDPFNSSVNLTHQFLVPEYASQHFFGMPMPRALIFPKALLVHGWFLAVLAH